ncbi:MAG: SAM-dependent chlorinase/fluorinase [Dehalococcoidia bacterium]|nr:MAG: SAM-dependent chlorinase/fluorinase [Dehalococcoidia bacterium]
MGAIITLTTDFGLKDAYVASMKGVMLSINPEVNLVDICHTIEPQNILQSAFVLNAAYRFFPKKSVHLVVVDPDVGSERRAIILRTPIASFVAPDNGVLSYIIQQSLIQPVTRKGKLSLRGGLKPGETLEAVHITNSRFWRLPVSPTFHGRDIFAPVAAALSLGFPPIEFGEPVTSVEVLPMSRPGKRPDGSLMGHIIHIDTFGNLITDVRNEDLPSAEKIDKIKIGSRHISGLVRTYSEGSGLIALIGSGDFIEISLKGGNAALLLDAKIGDEVLFTVQPEEEE